MSFDDTALDAAMEFVLQWEGGFVDDPKDPGGATKYGISLRFLRSMAPEIGDRDQDGDVDAEDVYALSRGDAESLYYAEFWYRLRLSALPPRVAVCVMDTAVNLGGRRAALILQNAIAASGCPVSVDGSIGPETIRACTEVRQDTLLREILLSRIWHYTDLCSRNPDFRRYLAGWLNRVAALDALITDPTIII